MKAIERKRAQRQRRKRRVRKHVTGTADRPRLSVFRSHKHIYAQIVDDMVGRTLVAASTMEAPVREKLPAGGGNRSAAEVVGAAVAEKAAEKGIRRVVFDRNGYRYFGRVRELAEAARKSGLEF